MMVEGVQKFLILHLFKRSKHKPDLWFLKCTLDGEDVLLYVDLRSTLQVYAYYCEGLKSRLTDITVNSLPLIKELKGIFYKEGIGVPPVEDSTTTNTTKKKKKTKNTKSTEKTEKKGPETLDGYVEDHDYDDGRF